MPRLPTGSETTLSEIAGQAMSRRGSGDQDAAPHTGVVK